MIPRNTLGPIALAAALLVAQPVFASASFGGPGDPIASCQYTSVTAQISATGVFTYNVLGNCDGMPIGGKLAYDPRAKSFQEVFFNSVEFQTMGNCPGDPWTTGAPCNSQKMNARGNDQAKLQAALDITQAPFSARVQAAAQLFQSAAARATRPNPPAPPVNTTAHSTVLWRDVQVQWLAPDESGNRPFVQFAVEARPQGAAGAAWTKLGDVPRQGANYDVTLRLPPRVAGYNGWDIRTCSVTVLAQSCAAVVTPDVTSNALSRKSTQSYGAAQAGVVPVVTGRPGVATMPSQGPTTAQPDPTNGVAARPGVFKTPAPVPPAPTPNPILTRPATPATPQPPRPTAPASVLHTPGTMH